ncbi:sulfite exporter TauE/SafE family protein [Legionella sp.]|uniref:sulfite exporter TauE/SafE family protein n=1 Tax=Legionella sp. TaxID=459 RepID=UPI00321F7CB1
MFSLFGICFLAGCIGALLQGMVGIGTGIIIVPTLTFILPYYHFPPDIAFHMAIATAMTAIAINSLTALIHHYHHNNIDWKLFRLIVGFSTLGSAIGALIAAFINGYLLKIIFSVFLMSLAGYLLLFKKSHHEISETMPSSDATSVKLRCVGLGIGFIASFVGSAGGVLMVPFLRKLNYPMRYAVGTSTLIGLPIALAGSAIYIVLGSIKMPNSSATIGYLHWPALLAITLAGLFSAPLGVRLATKLPTLLLQRLFAFMMLIIGLKMLNA